MIEIIIVALWVLIPGIFAWMLWGLRNIEKTTKQRQLILHAVYDYRKTLLDDGDKATYDGFRAIFEEERQRINYEKHMHELMMGRDPMRLYSFATLAAIKWYELQDKGIEA